MPVQYQAVEIVFTQGLDQKRDGKSTVEGKLVQADNVEFDKYGALNKRRGYESITITSEAFGETTEDTYTHLAVYEDELIIIGYSHIYSLASVSGSLPGTRYIVKRGPIPRGNIRRQDVATSRTGDDSVIPA